MTTLTREDVEQYAKHMAGGARDVWLLPASLLALIDERDALQSRLNLERQAAAAMSAVVAEASADAAAMRRALEVLGGRMLGRDAPTRESLIAEIRAALSSDAGQQLLQAVQRAREALMAVKTGQPLRAALVAEAIELLAPWRLP